MREILVKNDKDFLEAEFQRLCPLEIKEHSLAVALRCRKEAGDLNSEVLYFAGLFHDIGKSPELIRTGFHPLDGARHLSLIGEEDLAFLVARHSGAPLEAEQLGITLGPWQKNKFPDYQLALDRIDLTTSPKGKTISFKERLEDIKKRYGSDSSEAIALSQLEIF